MDGARGYTLVHLDHADLTRRLASPQFHLALWSLHRQLFPHIADDIYEYRDLLIATVRNGSELVLLLKRDLPTHSHSTSASNTHSDSEADANYRVVALSIFRILHCAVARCRMYIDDLVVTKELRGSGLGGVLLNWLVAEAEKRGCSTVTLDTGTQRKKALKFYLREGFEIGAFHLVKELKPKARL